MHLDSACESRIWFPFRRDKSQPLKEFNVPETLKVVRKCGRFTLLGSKSKNWLASLQFTVKLSRRHSVTLSKASKTFVPRKNRLCSFFPKVSLILFPPSSTTLLETTTFLVSRQDLNFPISEFNLLSIKNNMAPHSQRYDSLASSSSAPPFVNTYMASFSEQEIKEWDLRSDVLYHFHAYRYFNTNYPDTSVDLVNLDDADVQFYNRTSMSKLLIILLVHCTHNIHFPCVLFVQLYMFSKFSNSPLESS
jgi:hypothetical protein